MCQTVSRVLAPQTRDALRRIVDDRRRPITSVKVVENCWVFTASS